MKIDNYYYGCTGKLTGFVFDTEKRTYKRYELKSKEWERDCGNKFYPQIGFHSPGDIEYYFTALWRCNDRLEEIICLGFEADETMELDFGIFKR